MNYARKRDDNEAPIVAALRAVGASVLKLNIKGAPDLLVGWRDEMWLLEVKQRHGYAYGTNKKCDGLLPTQEAWWRSWMGKDPVVVTTPEEALEAIGATRTEVAS